MHARFERMAAAVSAPTHSRRTCPASAADLGSGARRSTSSPTLSICPHNAPACVQSVSSARASSARSGDVCMSGAHGCCRASATSRRLWMVAVRKWRSSSPSNSTCAIAYDTSATAKETIESSVRMALNAATMRGTTPNEQKKRVLPRSAEQMATRSSAERCSTAAAELDASPSSAYSSSSMRSHALPRSSRASLLWPSARRWAPGGRGSLRVPATSAVGSGPSDASGGASAVRLPKVFRLRAIIATNRPKGAKSLLGTYFASSGTW